MKKYIPGESKAQRKQRKTIEKLKKQEQSWKLSEIKNSTTVVTSVDKTSSNPIAFVLGNGVSRNNIDITLLQSYGKVYACNAIYRTDCPDYLIAVDTKMMKEIIQSGYHQTNIVYTNPNRFTREFDNINLFNPNLGWSSGPSALNLASTHGYSTIYILGFDYQGIGDNNGLVNNLYSGTENYKGSNDRATYFGNWSRQTGICIKKYPKIKYIRVVENENSFVPDNITGIENLTHITKQKFINNLSK